MASIFDDVETGYEEATEAIAQRSIQFVSIIANIDHAERRHEALTQLFRLEYILCQELVGESETPEATYIERRRVITEPQILEIRQRMIKLSQRGAANAAQN